MKAVRVSDVKVGDRIRLTRGSAGSTWEIYHITAGGTRLSLQVVGGDTSTLELCPFPTDSVYVEGGEDEVSPASIVRWFAGSHQHLGFYAGFDVLDGSDVVVWQELRELLADDVELRSALYSLAGMLVLDHGLAPELAKRVMHEYQYAFSKRLDLASGMVHWGASHEGS